MRFLRYGQEIAAAARRRVVEAHVRRRRLRVRDAQQVALDLVAQLLPPLDVELRRWSSSRLSRAGSSTLNEFFGPPVLKYG